MALNAGNIRDIDKHPDNVGSMAQAIEDAFLEEWHNAMDPQELPKHNKQMQLLFVAVAKGVINHLAAHPEAFKIKVDATNSGAGFHTHTASVSAIEKQ